MDEPTGPGLLASATTAEKVRVGVGLLLALTAAVRLRNGDSNPLYLVLDVVFVVGFVVTALVTVRDVRRRRAQQER